MGFFKKYRRMLRPYWNSNEIRFFTPLKCLGQVQLQKLYFEALADAEYTEKSSMVKGLKECIYMG